MKGQLVAAESALQTDDELASEYAAEHFDWKEKVGTRRNPTSVIWGQSTTGHDTVDMRVRLQCPSPGMQDAEATDFRAQLSNVAELASNRSRRRTFLFCQISGTNACGTLKTR